MKTTRRAWVPAFVALSLAVGCGGATVDVLAAGSTGSATGTGTGGAGGATATTGAGGSAGGAPGCDPEPQAGAEVVACGFAPNLVLVGVDAQAVYAMTGDQEIYRIDKTTFAKQLLHETSAQGNQGNAASLQGGRIYYTAAPSPSAKPAVLSISTASPGPASVVATDGIEGEGEALVTDAQYVFWEHLTSNAQINATDGISRAALQGGPAVQLVAGDGSPIAALGGYLYYKRFADSPSTSAQLLRVPVGGGASSVVIPMISDLALVNAIQGAIAVDPGHAYALQGSDPSGPFPLARYPVTGGSAQVIATLYNGSDIQLGPPTALRVDGQYLYFLRAVQLYRVLKDGSGMNEELLLEGQSLSPPVFDDTSVYVAYVRGGVDGPIEGAILRKAK